ncbi:hypothetical protein [Sutcliffiella horikoshii]|uniref:Uncharacterized protein n=1 Tax=Sutcliffiella horikoshii TaxID=79883 RepID=A0A5D4T9R9_9BACI|nr:hypothetical protein [Sutcliffiella horikoshii]TYS72440.1 hypothetical protein FZC75_10860 [Sutcliffiella horikoshii]
MDKQLKTFKKDMNQLLLKEVAFSEEESNDVLKRIHTKKKQPKIRYYSSLVAVIVIIGILSLSQLDFLSKNKPSMSDEQPAITEIDDSEEKNEKEIPDEKVEDSEMDDSETIDENLVEPEEEDPPIEKEPVPPNEEEETKDEATAQSSLFYIAENGDFKLKVSSDNAKGIGIGDSMEEVITALGEPDKRYIPEDDRREVFNYSSPELEEMYMIFSLDEDPVVEFVNTKYNVLPISEDSFNDSDFGVILEGWWNINIYQENQIFHYQKKEYNGNLNPYYHVKLITTSEYETGGTEELARKHLEMKDMTLEEFLEFLKTE